jgi:hypothetical protein
LCFFPKYIVRSGFWVSFRGCRHGRARNLTTGATDSVPVQLLDTSPCKPFCQSFAQTHHGHHPPLGIEATPAHSVAEH